MTNWYKHLAWLREALLREHHLPPLGWFVLANLGICLLLGFWLYLTSLDLLLISYDIYLHDIWLTIAILSLTGTLILLLASRLIVRLYLDARVVDESMGTKEQQLRLIMEKQARQAGINPPQLAIYQADALNAFAIGHSKQHAMLVISRGLVDHLSLDELSAVVGHEITHIANGDMLSLSIMQGVLNLCVHLPARLLGIIFDQWLLDRSAPGPVARSVTIFLQVFIGGLTSLLVMWFSRQREFRADAGGAVLAGRAEMLAALRYLYEGEKQSMPNGFSTFSMSGESVESRISRFFRSHPSLAERIEALQAEPAESRS